MTHEPAFCRDCLQDAVGTLRCRRCGSPRIIRHPELDTLHIAHIDCDAFYAAVEKRDNPSLRDVPVIIGGGKRGVVATACYLARVKGVRSAMPMFKALALCPEAVIVKPNMAKYVTVGRQVRERMRALTPLVEPLSIDEAFLDLAGTEKLHGASPARSLARLAREVESEIGITLSIGLAANKFLAKIASDLDKPRGFAVIGQDEAAAFLAPRGVDTIWGVGKATQERLAREGYQLISDLQAAEETALIRRLGAEGQRLWRLARGIDHRKVNPERETKSISGETTFENDIRDFRELEQILHQLSGKVSARLKSAGFAGRTLTLKLKTADFRIITRSRSLEDPTRLAHRIFDHARDLLRREADGRAFRLIGVGISELTDPSLADPDDLVDVQATKRGKAELAADALKARYGRAVVEHGIVLDTQKRADKGGAGAPKGAPGGTMGRTPSGTPPAAGPRKR